MPAATDYSVLWLCALAESELRAAIAVLDRRFDAVTPLEDDDNSYVFGSIHGHNVVIACMPLNQPGLVSAATVLAPIKRSFPNLSVHLFVGIAGGFPRSPPATNPEKDIYLGDVVLGTGAWAGQPAVIPVDYRRYEGKGQFNLLGQCSGPDSHLLQAVSLLMADEYFYKICQIDLAQLIQRNPAFAYPGLDKDRLYQSNYTHQGQPHTDCMLCGSEGLARQNLSWERGPLQFVVHKGSIASANSILEDATMREEIQKHYEGVLCYEMEAAAVANLLRPLVIRGVADYCDSHRSNKFINYAAATAAVVARQFLYYKKPPLEQAAKPVSHEGGHVSALTGYEQDEVKHARESRIAKGAEQAQTYLRALTVTDATIDREVLITTKGKRTDGTCVWIKSNEIYKSWIGSGTNFIWISGGPGKGKTILSIYITEELERVRSQKNSSMVLFFFCNNQHETRNTAVAILKGLLYQVLEKRPSSYKYIFPSLSISTDNAGTRLSSLSFVHELWSIFNNILQDSDFGTVFCLIDGLDECDEDSTTFLITRFLDLLEKTQGSFKLLIASRDMHLLRKVPTIRLDPDHDRQVVNDIERFISSNVEKLSSIDGFNKDFRDYVESVLIRRAEGTFLWVGFVINEISRKKTCTEIEETLRSISMGPTGLPAIYDRMLLNIQSTRRSLSRQMLCWVTLAARPLTVHELAIVVCLKRSSYVDECQAVRDHVQLCGHLLQIREQGGREEVWLVHQSAKDYLLRGNTDSSTGLEYFRIKPDETHFELAQFCFNYIQQSSLQESPLDWEHSAQAVGSSFLEYAVMHWIHHVNLSGTYAKEIVGISHAFFKKRSILRENFWKTYLNMSHDSEGYHIESLLHLAAYFGIIPIVDRLLSKRWKLTFRKEKLLSERDRKGRTLLYIAAERGQETLVKMFLDHGADVGAKTNPDGIRGLWGELTSLHAAAKSGQKAIAEILISRGADIEARTKRQRTPLIEAAQEGNFEIVRLLVDRKANIEALDHNGDTALLRAAFIGNTQTIQLLLNHGANINWKNNKGDTALMMAAFRGHLEVVQRLLYQGTHEGAHLEARDRDGNTALSKAAIWGKIKIMLLLLRSGANVNAKDVRDETPLFRAALHVGREAVELLLRWGANIEARNFDGNTALSEAAILEEIEAVQLLLELGANIESRNNEDETALILAARCGHTSVMELLLDHGASPGARDGWGRSPRHFAKESWPKKYL